MLASCYVPRRSVCSWSSFRHKIALRGSVRWRGKVTGRLLGDDPSPPCSATVCACAGPPLRCPWVSLPGVASLAVLFRLVPLWLFSCSSEIPVPFVFLFSGIPKWSSELMASFSFMLSLF